MRAFTCTFALALALAPVTRAAFAEAAWTTEKVRDRATLSKRPMPGADYFEHRVVGPTPMSAERAADAIWASARAGDPKDIKKRVFLRDEPNLFVIYDQIHTPIVSDRDFTLRVRRVDSPDRKRFSILFTLATDEGPPPQKGFVRIGAIRASWIVEDDGKGGALLTYTVYNEPGGSIAPFMVRGAQQRRAMEDYLRVRAQIEASPAR